MKRISTLFAALLVASLAAADGPPAAGRFRGVMLRGNPDAMTEDDFATLGRWGANLVRFQMPVGWRKPRHWESNDDYDAYIGHCLDVLQEKGRVVFVNAPIEREAFLRGGAFSGEGPNPLSLAYREAAKLAGVRRVVEKGDCPCVGITEHPAGEGSTVVVAVNHEPRAVECPVSIRGRIGRVWLGAPADGALALPPHGTAVFEVAEIFPNRKTET